MKQLTISLALLLTISTGFAKKMKVYVITLKNDTISLYIKVPGLIFHRFSDKVEEVDTIDSLGVSVTYDNEKIKEFGYVKDSVEYLYKFKPIQNGMLYFLLQVIKGPNTSLFQYDIAINQSVEQFYTFEKPAGEFLFLKNFDRLETLKGKLSAFYSNFPAAVQLISNKFTDRGKIQRDISEILKAVNGYNDIDFFKNSSTGIF